MTNDLVPNSTRATIAATHVDNRVSQTNPLALASFALGVWARWWKIVLPLGCLGSAAAFVVLLALLPPEYESKAIIRIRSVSPFVAFEQRNAGNNFVSTQLQLLRTRAVLDPAFEQLSSESSELLRDIDLSTRNPADWLTECTKARVQSGSELVEVSFTAANRELAQTALGAILDSYLAYIRMADRTVDDKVIALLSNEQNLLLQNVEKLKERILEEAEAAGLTIADKDVATGKKYTGLELSYQRAELSVMELEARLKTEQELYEAQTEVDFIVQKAIAQDPLIQDIQGRLTLLDAQLNSLNTTAKPGSKYLTDQRDQLASIRGTLNEQLEDAKKSRREQTLGELAAGHNENLASISRELTFKRTVRDGLLAQLNDQLLQEQGKKSKDQIKFEFDKADLERKEAVLDRISDRLVSLKTERRAPERISLIDAPDFPKTSPNLIKPAILSSAFLIVPFGIAFVYERLCKRVCDPQMITDVTAIPLIGETIRLPRFVATKSDSGSHEFDSPGRQWNTYEDSVANVAGYLDLAHGYSHKTGHKILAVMSALPNEGKTSLSMHLALSLAKRGCRTILVEADLRAPDFEQLFSADFPIGLSSVLRGENKLSAAIYKGIGHKLLDILPAGPKSASVLPLANTRRFTEIANRLREQYDCVVIDTAPVLAAIESLLVATISDASIMCTMNGHSRVGQLQSALKRLEQVGVVPAGIVLNGVATSSYYYRYGKYPVGAEA